MVCSERYTDDGALLSQHIHHTMTDAITLTVRYEILDYASTMARRWRPYSQWCGQAHNKQWPWLRHPNACCGTYHPTDTHVTEPESSTCDGDTLTIDFICIAFALCFDDQLTPAATRL